MIDIHKELTQLWVVTQHLTLCWDAITVTSGHFVVGETVGRAITDDNESDEGSLTWSSGQRSKGRYCLILLIIWPETKFADCQPTIIYFLEHKNINPCPDCDCVKMWRCCWMSMSATMTLSKWNKHTSEVNLHAQNINQWNPIKPTSHLPASYLKRSLYSDQSQSQSPSISSDKRWEVICLR